MLTLFGILPAAMAWQSRYGSAKESSSSLLPDIQPLLPGGNLILLAVGGAAVVVIAYSSLVV